MLLLLKSGRKEKEDDKKDLKALLKEKLKGKDEKKTTQEFLFPEVVELRLFQTLNIQTIMNDEPKPFENLIGKLELTFQNFSSLVEAQADTNDWLMKSITSKFEVRDPWKNTYGLNYNFERETAEDILGAVHLRFIPWLTLQGSTKYSFVNDRFLEHKAGFTLLPLSKCWSFQLDFVKSVDQDLLFQAGFTLIFGEDKSVSILQYEEQGQESDYNLLPGFRTQN